MVRPNPSAPAVSHMCPGLTLGHMNVFTLISALKPALLDAASG